MLVVPFGLVACERPLRAGARIGRSVGFNSSGLRVRAAPCHQTQDRGVPEGRRRFRAGMATTRSDGTFRRTGTYDGTPVAGG